MYSYTIGKVVQIAHRALNTDPGAEVIPGLFIGSISTASPYWVDYHGFNLVVNLSGVKYRCSVPVANIVMDDILITPSNVYEYIDKFRTGAIYINNAMNSGYKILVHCAAGINRSATTIAFYLLTKGYSLEQIHELLGKANQLRGVELFTNHSFVRLLESYAIDIKKSE
jgi:hypothetical protein